MSVVTFNDEWPRWRESQVIWAPLSRARLANVCRKLWNVRFSCVGPTRLISAAPRTLRVRPQRVPNASLAIAHVVSVDRASCERFSPLLTAAAPRWPAIKTCAPAPGATLLTPKIPLQAPFSRRSQGVDHPTDRAWRGTNNPRISGSSSGSEPIPPGRAAR